MNWVLLRRFASHLVLVLCGSIFSTLTQAQTLTWNGGNGGPSDGSGSWSYSGTNWWNGAPGGSFADGNDVAFGAGAGNGSAGTVSISPVTPLSPNSITFAPTGNGGAYTITGGSIGVAFNSGGSLPLTVNNNATIASPFVGAGGLTISGSRALTLQGNYSSYSGPTAISSGTLNMAAMPAYPTGTVAHYAFEGHLIDVSGNGNNAAFVNGPATYTLGQFGQAVAFNGSNQYATVPYSSSLGISGSYTASAWMNVNVQPAFNNIGQAPLISTRNGSEYTFDMQYGPSSAAGAYYLHADIGTGSAWLSTAANYTLPGALTGWNMITYVVKPSGYTIYLDGLQVASGAFSGTPLFMQPGQTLSFAAQQAGTNPYGDGVFLNGSLDDIAIYNSALSQSQITGLYQGQGATLPSANSMTVSSGATWNLNGNGQTVAGLSGAGNITVGSGGALVVNTAGGTTFNGIISDSGSGSTLFITGNGTQGLAHANTFSGATSVTGGALDLLNQYAIQNSTLVTGSGSVIFDSLVSGHTFTIGGLSGAGNLALQDNAGSSDPVLLIVGNNNTSMNYSGLLSGAGTLNKVGTGTLSLSSASNFSGGILLSGGTLNFANGALGTTNPVFAGGTLQYALGTSQDIGSLLTSNTAAIVLDTNGNTVPVSNVGSTNSGGVTKIGAGTLVFGGINAYGGPTTISGGTVQVGTGSSLPSLTPVNLTASSAALNLNGATQTVGSLTGVAGSFVVDSGSLITGNDNTNATFAGVISGSGSLTQIGTGSMLLTGPNTYTGPTTVSSGTLAIGPAGSLLSSGASVANGATLNVAGSLSAATNLTANGAVDFTNASQTIATLSDSGAGARSVTLNNTNFAITGTSTFSGSLSGAGTLTVAGGAFTLLGSSASALPTTINSGTLLLSNAGSNNIAAASPVTVNSAGTLNVSGLAGGSGITLAGGQTLRGMGTVVGSVMVGPGSTILAGTGNGAGTGIGTLTLANSLTFTSGATLATYLGTPGSGTASPGYAGLISVQGNLTLANSLNLSLLSNNNLAGSGSLGNGFYELFSYTGILSGASTNTFTPLSGKTLTFYYPSHQVDVQVQITALNWTGTAGSSWDTLGSTNWASGGTAASYVDGTNVTFSDTNAITGSPITNSSVMIQAAGVQPNLVTFNNNAVNYTVNNASPGAPGGIAGTTGIVKSGSGMVNLQGANSFQGLVAVNGGILNISNSAALGSSAGVSVASGAALQVQGGIAVGAVPLSLSGSGVAASPAGALNNVSGTNSYAGVITLSSPSTIAAAAGQLTLSGGVNLGGNVLSIGGTGTVVAASLSQSGGLTINSGATLNLSGSMSAAANVIDNGGVLAASSLVIGGPSGAPGTGSLSVNGGLVQAQSAFTVGNGTTTVNLSGGTLQTPAWGGSSNVAVSFNGGTLQATASSATSFLGLTSSANIAAGGAVIDSHGNNISITQSLTGVGGLTKTGAGILALGGANSYGGATVINGGTLQTLSQLPGTAVTIAGGAALDLDAANQQATTLSGGGLVTNSASGGNVTLTLNPTSGTSNFSGTISDGAGTMNLVLNGLVGPTQVLSGVNTFSGSAYVESSTLDVANSGALLNATVISYFGGGSSILLDQSVASRSFTFGGLAGSFLLSLSNTAGAVSLTVGGNNQSTTYTGIISGSGSLTKIGSGTLTLGNANTYSTGTFINGGELSLNKSSAIALTRNITFGGGVLQYTINNTHDFSTHIVNSTGPVALDTNGQLVTLTGGLAASNLAGLTKLGSGTLAMFGTNSFVGPLSINGGDVNINSTAALPNGDNITFGGGVLQYTSSNMSDYSNIIKNSTGPVAIDTNSISISFASVLDASNSGGLTKLGGGTLALSASNAYSGTTTVAAGLLQLRNQAGVPDNSTLAVSGGTFDLNGYSKSMNIVSGGALSGGLIASQSAAAVTLNLSVVPPTALESVVGTTFGNGSGTLSLTVSSTNGSGLQVTSSNAFSGGTTINNGYVRLGNASALGTGTITVSNSGFAELWWNTGSGTISNNFVLNTLGGNQVAGSQMGQQTAVYADGGGTGGNGTYTISGSIDLAANGGIDGNSANALVVAGRIFGPGGLVKGIGGGSGGNVVTLTNTANSYQGGTTINDGTLAITADAVLGSGSITFGGNSTLQPAANNVVLSPSRLITISTGAGTINSQNLTMTIPGTIGGTGGLTVAGGSAGLLILSGSNTYGGATNINGGELRPASAAAIPTGGSITFGGGALQYSPSNTLDYAGQIVNSSGPIAIDTNGLSVGFSGSLAASNTGGLNKLGAGRLILTASNAFSGAATVSGGTLQLGDGATTNGSVAGNIVNNSALVFANPASQTYGGAISGSGSFTKIGAGTLQLTATHSYTGPTFINAGTVRLGGLSATVSGFGSNLAGVPGPGLASNSNGTWTINSFAYGSGFLTTSLTGGTLTMTDGPYNNNNTGQERSAFYNTPVPVTSSFAASFTYQSTNGGGDNVGFAFILQNDSRGVAALADPANGLGVGLMNVGGYVAGTGIPINNSAEIEFGLGSNGTTGYATSGAINLPTSTGLVNPGSGDPINVSVSYNAAMGVLSWSMTDVNNQMTFSTSQTVGSLAAVTGGSTAYVGLSGADEGNVATQTISNFSFSTPPTNVLPAATALHVSNSAILDLFGTTQTVASLSGAGAMINSNSATPVTLTVGGPSNQNSSFSGSISDTGLAGAIGLTAAGNGTFVMSGSNTYRGPTSVNSGVLAAGAANALSPNSPFTVNAGTLDATAAPQTLSSLNIGALGSLNLSVSNLLTVSGTTTFGGTLNIYGNPTGGTDELMSYSSYNGSFSLATSFAGYTLEYNASQLDLVATGGPSIWAMATSGSWASSSNWINNTVPSAVGAAAVINPSTSTSISITLDGPQTIGSLVLGAGSLGGGYTLTAGQNSGGSAGPLTFNNSGSGARITVTDGNHTIDQTVPVILADNLKITPSAGSTLQIAGNISEGAPGGFSLTLGGSNDVNDGMLILSGSNNYTGGTFVNDGTLIVNSATALPDGSSLTVGQGASSIFAPAAAPSIAAVSGGVTAVPEPGSVAMLIAALVVGVGLMHSRKWI